MIDNIRSENMKRSDYFFLILFVSITIWQVYYTIYAIIGKHEWPSLSLFLLFYFLYFDYSILKTMITNNKYEKEKIVLLAQEKKLIEELKKHNLIDRLSVTAEEAIQDLDINLRRKNKAIPLDIEVENKGE